MQVVIISGIPGAGKTTVARLLASRLPRAAHLEGDLIGSHFVVSGFVPPQGPTKDEAERQLELRRRNMCLLADSFAGAGFVPVIDDVVVGPSVLQGYVRGLTTRPLMLVQLTPSLDVVRSRDENRYKQVFELWQHLDAELRTAMPNVGLWIDTSNLSASETVEEIMERFDEAVVAA